LEEKKKNMGLWHQMADPGGTFYPNL